MPRRAVCRAPGVSRADQIANRIAFPMRVLVIEDELQLARHVTSALFRTGHETNTVHDGAEGLRAALDKMANAKS